MDWMKVVGGILIIMGVVGVSYGDISATASVLTAGIGFYLLVESEKLEKKKR